MDKQYKELVANILDFGVSKQDRTGIGTISLFGKQIHHKMNEGFPLLTIKKMAWKQIVTELLWFLRGDTNIKYLIDNNCHIWDGDCYKAYATSRGHNVYVLSKEEFINKIKQDSHFASIFGNLGRIYGYQWRSFDGIIDQIKNLIWEINTNPDSRRLMVTAWNPNDLDYQVLPPCHYGFQVWTRELSAKERWEWYKKNGDSQGEIKLVAMNVNEESNLHRWLDKWAPNIPKKAISLMWNQRSVDVGLGLPFNIASYALLLSIIAKEVNMIPDELIGNLGDCHIYNNHISNIKTVLFNEPFNLPVLKIKHNRKINDISEYETEDFIIKDYDSHPVLKLELNN